MSENFSLILEYFYAFQTVFHHVIFCSTETTDIYAGFLVCGGDGQKWLRGESEKA